MSLAGILQERAEKEKKNVCMMEASNSIKQLKQEQKDIDQKIETIRRNIARGVFADENQDLEPEVEENQQNLTPDRRAENLFNITKLKQKMLGIAYMTGITLWKQDNNDLSVTFDPYVRGQPKGAYELRMTQSFNIVDHNLPIAVPLRSLHKDHLDPSVRKQNSIQNLSPFLKSVFKYLRCFLSRQDQVQELKDDSSMDEFIKDIETNDKCTKISVTFTVRHKDEVEDCPLESKLNLAYQLDSERPMPGGIQVVIAEEWQDEKENLEAQCQLLYKHSLKNGFLAAFTE